MDTPMRTFHNGYMEVRVFEENTKTEGRALVFETDFGRRYAFVYPTNWRDMHGDALRRFAEQIRD